MSNWYQYQNLQERQRWEADEAAQKEYQSWLDMLDKLRKEDDADQN